MENSATNYLFKIETRLGFSVRTTKNYWEKIILKHPEIQDMLENVKFALSEPSEIRRSKSDEMIFLFYIEVSRHWISAVVKRFDSSDGFLVTAYLTDKIKEGEVLWRK